MDNQFRVLVVDDDDVMRQMMVTLLHAKGNHQIDEAGDGRQALDMLLGDGAAYDVVFLDRDMPCKDGIEVAKSVREAGQRMPIVMVTASSQTAHVREAIEAGVSDYLVKPFLPDAFTQKAARVFRQLEMRRLGSAFRVKHAMTAPAASVPVNMQAREAAELLVQQQISGFPVVDSEDRPVGIVTEYELVRILFDPQIGQAMVGDVMSDDVICVQEETLLTDAARQMLEFRVRRLPVVRDGRLIGVIARRDLIRFALENGESLQRLVEIARLAAEETATAAETPA